jgi:MOSC domain
MDDLSLPELRRLVDAAEKNGGFPLKLETKAVDRGARMRAPKNRTRSEWLLKGSGTLATVDDRKETSLRACIAHMLDIDVSEVPTKREANMGQWLAMRNLGLVPVASPETFEWPGRFLGLRSDSTTWAVFFGVPPGIVYDPLAEPDEEKQDAAALDAAFVLAEHDPRRGTEPASGTENVGTVELIALASEAEGPMRSVSTAEAIEGRGLLGDRYERKAGTFSKPGGRGYDLTLVEAEALEELSAKGVELAPIEARRNLVVRGIALDDLIGRRFRVGEVECYGQRRCEPCSHLEGLTQPGVLRGLVHRGGLRADVLSSGRIRTGDSVEALP